MWLFWQLYDNEKLIGFKNIIEEKEENKEEEEDEDEEKEEIKGKNNPNINYIERWKKWK